MTRQSAYVEDANPRAARCTGKVAFCSPQAAWHVSLRRSRMKGEPYRCNCCGHWHIGRGA